MQSNGFRPRGHRVRGLTVAAALSAALLSNVAQGSNGQPAESTARPTQVEQAKEVKEVKAEVIVLHGTNDGKGLDPALPADVRGKLEKPPFSSFNSYKLLEKHDLVLPKGEAKEKKLPDGGKMSLLFKEMTAGKKKEDPTKFVLSASIEKADGKQFLPGLDVNAVKGDYFFIAGQKYSGGILVIGVKVQ